MEPGFGFGMGEQMSKNIEDDTEAMILIVKLMQLGYSAEDIRRYASQVAFGARKPPQASSSPAI